MLEHMDESRFDGYLLKLQMKVEWKYLIIDNVIDLFYFYFISISNWIQ
jgi:hypothetical protein